MMSLATYDGLLFISSPVHFRSFYQVANDFFLILKKKPSCLLFERFDTREPAADSLKVQNCDSPPVHNN